MKRSAQIDKANQEVTRRMMASRPCWVDVRPLRDVVAGLGAREVTHAGPPASRACGALRSAVTAAVRAEGWADTDDAAWELVRAGTVTLRPNHHAGGAGDLAGVASPSTPVLVIEERAPGPRQGALAYAVPSLGDLSAWRDAVSPALGRAVRASGGVDLDAVISHGLQHGDAMCLFPAAATTKLLATLWPWMRAARLDDDEAAAVHVRLAGDDGFAAPLAMGAARLAADGAGAVADSTVVTALASNGVDFGVRVAGLGDAWFTAPAPTPEGCFEGEFTPDDAGRDLGDSGALEVIGLGAFALSGATSLLPRVGVTVPQALEVVRAMQEITVARHRSYRMPLYGDRGASLGVDVRRVVETNRAPVLCVRVTHREGGRPPVGAGLSRAPRQCFVAALERFAAV